MCVKYCPNSAAEKERCVEILQKSKDRISVGIENANGFYRCKVRNNDDLIRSASGGFVAEFSKKLLSEGIIDCVVHGERVIAKTGSEHYRACISRSLNEIDSRRSSIYGPVCFDNVIEEFRDKKEKILVVGVPCVIRGIKRLFRNNSYQSDSKSSYSINPCSLLRKDMCLQPNNNDITIYKYLSLLKLRMQDGAFDLKTSEMK